MIDLSKRVESLKDRFERFEDLIPQTSKIEEKASVIPDEKRDVFPLVVATFLTKRR